MKETNQFTMSSTLQLEAGAAQPHPTESGLKSGSERETAPPKETAPPLPRLAYTMAETAEILGISYISVHRLLARGLLKSSTALRHKLIPYSEIQAFLRRTTN